MITFGFGSSAVACCSRQAPAPIACCQANRPECIPAQVSTFLSELESAAGVAAEGGPNSGEAVAKLLRAVAGVRDQVDRFSTERSGLQARHDWTDACSADAACRRLAVPGFEMFDPAVLGKNPPSRWRICHMAPQTRTDPRSASSSQRACREHGARVIEMSYISVVGTRQVSQTVRTHLPLQTCVADAVKQAESLAAENVELRRMGEDALLDK